MNELRRHIYSNTVGRFTIKQLIGRLTPPHLTPCSEGNQEVDVNGGTSEEPTADDSGTGSPTLCPIPARGSVAGQSSLLDEDGSISGAPDSGPLPSKRCHGHRLALNIAKCVEALHGCAGGAVRISPVLFGATGLGRAAYSHTGHMHTRVLWVKGTT